MQETTWDNVKTTIKNHIPAHSFRMWIEPLEFLRSYDNGVVLSCPNSFSKNRIQHSYASLIESEFNNVSQTPLKLLLEITGKHVVTDKKSTPKKHTPQSKTKSRQLGLPKVDIWPKTGRMLQNKYTFDSFVVGNNNDFAFSAALSLASNRQSNQNALYLLSKTGMGKTHLSQAMGHHILSSSPSDRVYYTTAEDFLNEMICGFKNKTIDKFKSKYRNQCDVLLLEDIHFLTGKDHTQFELGQILDYMFDANKKIIFTSCYLPTDIPKMKDQLRSRLSSSLISNIDPPDFKTRVRILRQKAKENNFKIPSNIIDYLADVLSENVRQLESGIQGIMAKSSLLGVPIDLELAESVVKNIANLSKAITIDVIKRLVCREYGIKTEDIILKSRKQSIARPRQVAIYLSRRYTDHPLKTIGKSFNKYHATVLHSIGVVEKAIKENPTVKKQVEIISRKLEAGKF